MTSYFRTLDQEPIAPENVDLFILNAGFEERSISVIKNLEKSFSQHVLICQIDQSGEKTKPQIIETELAKSNALHEVELDTESPIEIADSLMLAIKQISIADEKPAKVAIDITCFTHEILLILLEVVRISFSNCELSLFYTQAESYDTDNPATHKKLSFGVREIRSILGYSGIKTPSKTTHLILLAGFEIERALSIIENVEPNTVSIGYGDDTSIDTSVQSINFEAASEIIKRSGYGDRIDEFSFPPFDFVGTKKALECIVESSDKNIVVVPMNTKISTIGAALLVEKHPKVQLIYGLAEAYNTSDYSIANTASFWFRLDE